MSGAAAVNLRYLPLPTFDCCDLGDAGSHSLLSHGHQVDRDFPDVLSQVLAAQDGQLSGRVSRTVLAKLGITEQHALLQIMWHSCDMLLKHVLELGGLLFSFFCCVVCGAVHEEYVDSSFFKATGLLLAVMLSLRAKNALQRRQHLMNVVLRLMNSARNLLGLVHPTGQRQQRLLAYLCFCYQEVASFVDEVSEHEPIKRHRLDDLFPEDREAALILRAKRLLHTSPRPLLIYLRQVCDEVYDLDEHVRLATKAVGDVPMDDDRRAPNYLGENAIVDRISVLRRWHRNIETQLHDVLMEFDNLMMFRERLLTPHFRWMIHCVIFLYVTLYPWCVRNESRIILGLTSVGMGFVFYGLNHVTNGLEDPMKQKGQGFHLALTFQKMFAELSAEALIHEQSAQWLSEKRPPGVELNLTEDVHDELVDFLCRQRKVSKPSPQATQA